MKVHSFRTIFDIHFRFNRRFELHDDKNISIVEINGRLGWRVLENQIPTKDNLARHSALHL